MRMRDPHTGKYNKSLNAALVVDIPLDPRGSLFLAWGDWFSATCLIRDPLAVHWGR